MSFRFHRKNNCTNHALDIVHHLVIPEVRGLPYGRGFSSHQLSIAKHRATRFPLQGAHVAVPCSDCHKVGLGGRTDKVLPFHFEDRNCTACHKDPHKGEFDKQMARKRANGTAFGCEACHSVKSWGDINGFDHSKTKFQLLGAHRTVACADCHKPAANYESRFKGTPMQCEACHKDAHDSQFVAKDGQTHSPTATTPSAGCPPPSITIPKRTSR